MEDNWLLVVLHLGILDEVKSGGVFSCAADVFLWVGGYFRSWFVIFF